MTPPVLAPNKKAAPEDGFLTKGLPLLLFGFLSLADRLLKELVVPFDDLSELVGGEIGRASWRERVESRVYPSASTH